MYEVRATGTFIDLHNPGDIIIDIMRQYADVGFNLNNYDTEEFGLELRSLPAIGICLDEQEDIYAIIEKIQKGSILGFQFMGKYDVFTARLDNPNRKESLSITSEEILNLDEIEVDYNADLYATYTDVMYAKRWYTDKDEIEYLHNVDKSIRHQILDIHRVDKPYEDESLLTTNEAATLKGKIMLEDFSEIRPVITGIKVFGLQYFGIRIYDIINIDFVIHGDIVDNMPGNLIQLINFINPEHVVTPWNGDYEIITMDTGRTSLEKNNRKFIGNLRCQVLSKEIDPGSGAVTISVRQRSRSKYLGAEYD